VTKRQQRSFFSQSRDQSCGFLAYYRQRMRPVQPDIQANHALPHRGCCIACEQ
jgi:hypothetical protein